MFAALSVSGEPRYEDDGPEGFEPLTVVAPFYWYTVMRRRRSATV